MLCSGKRGIGCRQTKSLRPVQVPELEARLAVVRRRADRYPHSFDAALRQSKWAWVAAGLCFTTNEDRLCLYQMLLLTFGLDLQRRLREFRKRGRLADVGY